MGFWTVVPTPHQRLSLFSPGTQCHLTTTFCFGATQQTETPKQIGMHQSRLQWSLQISTPSTIVGKYLAMNTSSTMVVSKEICIALHLDRLGHPHYSLISIEQ